MKERKGKYRKFKILLSLSQLRPRLQGPREMKWWCLKNWFVEQVNEMLMSNHCFEMCIKLHLYSFLDEKQMLSKCVFCVFYIWLAFLIYWFLNSKLKTQAVHHEFLMINIDLIEAIYKFIIYHFLLLFIISLHIFDTSNFCRRNRVTKIHNKQKFVVTPK